MNISRHLYLLGGHLTLLLGIAGAFLPVLPTTPFLLLSAFLYSKSSPRIHQWLITHPIIGKPIREWEESGVIRLWAKILATIMISLVIFFKFQRLAIPEWLKIIFSLILVSVLIFIWTRPSKATK
ncbi:MAG: YbaN family protein [Bacteriovoracaceae bacterium]|jgi:uncharacterized membrane protein YbaN (DUF454 family)|nr:YbaN family protein [Bacteriovoracaceae bacterium]